MKRFAFLARSTMLWATLGVLGIGCDGAGDTVESQTAALTAEQQNILGFEQPGLWSTSSGPVNTLSDDHTQGAKSLSVTPKGYVPYTSSKLSSLGAVGRKVTVDLKLPRQQPNRFWFGSSQLFISIPSKNVNNSYAGQVELTGLPLETWTTLSFDLDCGLSDAIGSTYTDLTITIVLNVPSNATGTYLLDNVRFAPPENQGTGGAGTGGRGTGGRGTGGAGTGGRATGGASTGGASTGGASTGGASTGGRGTGGASSGGASTGGRGTGGASSGGASTGGRGTGGASSGGASTGGASTGGRGTGGASTGGASTGGASTGGASTGGRGTGGASTGGASTGGASTGGASTGGRGTGGASTGGASTGGASTGGRGTGGASTGGASTGGASTGGRGTGGASTGGASTGGASTGGRGTGGASSGGANGTGGANVCTQPTHCPPNAACEQCTTDNCFPPTDGCDLIADPADRQLCEDAYGCFVATSHPGSVVPGSCTNAGDPTRCWCGTNPTTCLTDAAAANGPCRDQVVAAAKSADPGTIKLRFVDPGFPLGRAVNLSSCRGSFCGPSPNGNGECPVP